MIPGAPSRIGAAALGVALAASACASGGGRHAPEARLVADYTGFLALLDAGRSKAAANAAAAIARDGSATDPSAEDFELFAAAPLFAEVRFGAWDALLARTAPPADRPVAVALFEMARGVALAARRDLEGASAAREAFAAARQMVGPETRLGDNLAQDVLNVAGFELDGRFLDARGDRERALASWRAAAQAGDILSSRPPAGWYHAPRESLGGALLRAGRWQEAEQVFRAGLERQPESPRLLFGLSLALAAARKPAESEAARARFLAAWKRADVPLTLEDL